MLGVFVERERAFKDLLVLLIIVVLGMRFVNGGDIVVWSVVAILTRSRSFRPIMAAVTMVTAVVVVVVIVASVVGSLIIVSSWAMSACVLVEATSASLASAY